MTSHLRTCETFLCRKSFNKIKTPTVNLKMRAIYYTYKGQTEMRSCSHLLPWESFKYYIFRACVCSLKYPVCNAYAQYCHLWPLRLYNIFPHYLTKGTIFGGVGNTEVPEQKMCVLIFCTMYIAIPRSRNKRKCLTSQIISSLFI